MVAVPMQVMGKASAAVHSSRRPSDRMLVVAVRQQQVQEVQVREGWGREELRQ